MDCIDFLVQPLVDFGCKTWNTYKQPAATFSGKQFRMFQHPKMSVNFSKSPNPSKPQCLAAASISLILGPRGDDSPSPRPVRCRSSPAASTAFEGSPGKGHSSLGRHSRNCCWSCSRNWKRCASKWRLGWFPPWRWTDPTRIMNVPNLMIQKLRCGNCGLSQTSNSCQKLTCTVPT